MSKTSPPFSLPTRLSCSICSKSFTRTEHLKRHELVHTRQRSFQCDQCSKDFFRRDALQRHMYTHQISGPSLVQKGARACFTCAAAKVRCSGDLPACHRCQQRAQFPCRYPNMPVNDIEQPNLDMDTAQTHDVMVYQDSNHLLQRHDSQHSLGLGSQTILQEQGTSGNGVIDQFDSTCWDPSMLSTINWLANDDRMYSLGTLKSNESYPSGFHNYVQSPEKNHMHPYTDSMAVSHMYIPTPDMIQDFRQDPHSSTGMTHTSETPRTLQSQYTASDSGYREGEFYVDGQATRLPRTKRRRLTMTVSPTTVNDESESLGFSLDVVLPVAISMDGTEDFKLSDNVYQSLIYAFDGVCTEPTASRAGIIHDGIHELMDVWERMPSSFFSSYFSGRFPSKAVFEKLVQLYIESIHPLVPILHGTSLSKLSWQLILVIAAIGAHFFPVEGVSNLVPSLNEFSRRVLLVSLENSKWLPGSKLEQAQMRLLHAISCMYSGIPMQKDSKHSIPQSLVDFFFTSQSATPDVSAAFELQDQWSQWVEQETYRRTSYAIWQLDCMCVIHFQQEARFKLEDATLSLPCHESLWAASSCEDWRNLSAKYTDVGSLDTALQRLYVEKSLLPATGEFSQILLIHGLFRRLWEVESYLKHPLSQWTPTAQKQSAEFFARTSPVWLPSVPTYSQWRNSACDCLDILHWKANASIGATSGIEHPTVMHLHFARVVLLTPHKQIVTLAKHLADIEHNDRSSQDNQIIRRWASQDQYKARLAMIHAGVLFWHIRRYSASGFYEPATLAIATLALWAFSAFSERVRQSTDTGSTPHETSSNQGNPGDEDSVCDIILLDRPTDDELVQQFVREGYKMRANMNGVGDLYGRQGPQRVLAEGRKLLLALGSWGDAAAWVKVLDGLIKISKQHRLQ